MYHRVVMSILSPLTGPMTAVLNGVASQAWEPLVSLCRSGTLSQLQNIRLGKLVVYERSSSKASMVFGAEREGLPLAILNVHGEKFWVRLALFADMVRLRIRTDLMGALDVFVCMTRS